MGVRLFVMTKPREPLPSRYLLLRRCDQDHHCSEASRQAQPAARRQQGPRPLRHVRMCAFELTNRAHATVLEAERLHSDRLTRPMTGAGANCVRATVL